MTATDIAQTAGKAYGAFETRERQDGEAYVALKDDAPQWLHELVREAHGDFLPDDWRYAKIRDALGSIHDDEPEDLDDYASEWADSAVDVYTGSRLQWLASNLNRAAYCDEAASEFGDEGNAGIIERVGWGQYMEALEIYNAVVEALRDEVSAVDA